MIFRRKRTRRAVETYYWEGFFARMGSGYGPDPSTEGGHPWHNAVRNIAFKAGWLRADEAIKVDSQQRFGHELDRTIPPSVYAEAMNVE